MIKRIFKWLGVIVAVIIVFILLDLLVLATPGPFFPEKKQYTQTNINLKNDYRGRPVDEIPLESSGLLGPVIVKEEVFLN